MRAETIEKEKMTAKNLELIETLDRLGKERGKTVSQMALGWLLSHDWMTAPIIGANSLEQLEDNLGAASLRLSEREKKTLDDLSA